MTEYSKARYAVDGYEDDWPESVSSFEDELINAGVPARLAAYLVANYRFPGLEKTSPGGSEWFAEVGDLADLLRGVGRASDGTETVAGQYPELRLPRRPVNVRTRQDMPGYGRTVVYPKWSGLSPRVGVKPPSDFRTYPYRSGVGREVARKAFPGRPTDMPGHVMAHELGHAAGVGFGDPAPWTQEAFQQAREGYVPLGTPRGHSGLPGELMADLYAADVTQPGGKRVWDDPRYELLFHGPEDIRTFLREAYSHTPHMRSAPPPGLLDTLRQQTARVLGLFR